MPEWSLLPGDAPAILDERGVVVVLAGDGAEARARDVYRALPTSTGAEGILDVLIADGVASAPGFVVGSLVDGVLLAFVRGGLRLTVERAGAAPEHHDGEGMHTWREVGAADVVGLAIDVAPFDTSSGEVVEEPARPGPLAVRGLRLRARARVPRAAVPPTRHAPPPPVAVAPVAPAANLAPTAPYQAPPTAPTAFEQLFGSTRSLAVEDAAVRAEDEGHDDPAALDDAGTGLSAVVCPDGHTNPPERAQCSRCGRPLRGASVTRVRRAELGTIVLPDGRRLPIQGTMLIGRSPRAERTDGAGIPTLVALDDPSGDLSRTHVRLTTEGWSVLVEDLTSTNGTVLTAPDGSARRLRAGEQVLVTSGFTAELGGRARVTFEDIP